MELSPPHLGGQTMLLVSLAGALSSHWHGVRKSWGGPGDRSHHSVAGGGSMQARAGKQWWDSLWKFAQAQ